MNFTLVIVVMLSAFNQGGLTTVNVPGFQTKTACEEAMRDQVKQISARTFPVVVSSGCYSK